MSLVFILLYYFRINDMHPKKTQEEIIGRHIVPSETTGSLFRCVRETGGICWDLLVQGTEALHLTYVMSCLPLNSVKDVISSAWSCSVMDAERQKHCKLFSERPFSAPSVLIFSIWFSKQIVLCLEDIPIINVFVISHICWVKIKLFL